MLQSNQKMQFLDPFGSLIKLILLNFYPIGAKLRIADHKIVISEDGLFEKLLWRKYYSDSRQDINILYPMIVRIIEIYLPQEIKNKKNSQENIYGSCKTEIIHLIKHLITGLYQLEETYNGDNVMFVLQYFVLLLDKATRNEYTRDLLPPHLIQNLDANLLDIEKIKVLWSTELIIEIEAEFQKCFSYKQNNDVNMMNASLKKINSILENQESKFKEILITTNSF
jgi:hypothetical protein